MARAVTPPPAIERSRDLPMIVTALLALLALVAGVISLFYGGELRTSLMLFAIAALAALAAGLRMVKARKAVSTANLSGDDN